MWSGGGQGREEQDMTGQGRAEHQHSQAKQLVSVTILHDLRVTVCVCSEGSAKFHIRIGRVLSSVCVYVCMCVCRHFQTASQKPLAQSNSNFIWSLHGMVERKFVQMVQVT